MAAGVDLEVDTLLHGKQDPIITIGIKLIIIIIIIIIKSLSLLSDYVITDYYG